MAVSSSTSPAVGHALDILTYLARHAQSVGATVIARDLGLPRSSAYHILTVLAERGFVVYLPEARGYTLGAAALQLSSPDALHERLERLARPIMREVAGRLGSTIHLGVLRGNSTMYLLKEAPARPNAAEPELVTAVGVLLPAHLTANGRAILAQLDQAQVSAVYSSPGDFVSRTGRGPRSLPELLAGLALERRQGWSEENELVTAGLRSAGAAIFESDGLPVAALSTTWRAKVLPRDPRAIGEQLVGAAAEISRRLQARGKR